MTWGADPVWTVRPNPVSRENPIGVTTTRNRRLFNDLVYPLLSDAITYRFRYLSFWAWVLNHTDGPSTATRADYEKIFFLSNIAHDCPDDGHTTNGIVGAERSIDGQYLEARYTEDADSFEISASDFELASGGGCGFDSYYQSLMQRLWLIHGKIDLTPVGRQLAEAFANSVDVSFEEVQTAVQAGRVSQDLLQRFAQDGCCCLLRSASSELRVLTNALLANFTQTENPTQIRLRDTVGPEKLDIDAWYPADLDGSGAGLVDIESLFESDGEETDLAEYFQRRLGDRGRASMLLFLSLSGRVQQEPAPSGWDLDELTDIRTAWEYFVHTHYFVIGSEALFKAWLHGLRACEPITTDALLTKIFEGDEYQRTLQSVIRGEIDVDVDEAEDDQLWRVLDAIYYQNWFAGSISVEHDLPSTGTVGDESTITWGELLERAQPETVQHGVGLTPTSARVLHDLIQAGGHSGSDLVRAQRLAGYATVLLAHLYRRGQRYDTADSYEPYRRWFDQLASSPRPQSFWRASYDEAASAGSVLQSFTHDRVVTKHHSVTRRKIRDHPSQTARHMRRRSDGSWEFISMYSTGHLSQSWLRLERMIDALYELTLTSAATKRKFRPTDHGRRVLEQYGIDL
ncbi:hypothetical protein ACLI4U_12600 [Natrialbaceae archaeon A-CW2]